jgi:membrane-bound lytic murein transglycosylase F
MQLRGRSVSTLRLTTLAVCALLCLLAGCGESSAPNSSSKPPFVESGDFEQIRERGTLRVLVPNLERSGYLPRHGSPLDYERELIRNFAEQERLDLFWVTVESREDLIPFLLEGKGDLIASNLTATSERRKRVAFTVPVKLVREQLVTRASDETISGPEDLEGRYVAVRRSSSFWNTIERWREKVPGIELQEVEEHLDTDEILHRVATRRLDVTVADSNHMETALDYRDDLRVACDLTDDQAVGWAVRPSSGQLLRNLNRFLSEYQLARRSHEIHTGDLSEIKKKKVLRLLTKNSAATYFLWRGRLMGFEYELAQEFAKSQGLRMDVIVPRRGEDILTMLREGHGDLIAAALTPTEDRRRDVAFSHPYNYVSQVVVSPAGEMGLKGPGDLAQRLIHVQERSAYWDTLSRLQANGIPLVLQSVPEHLETEEIIGLVGNGAYPLTVADSHILDIELTWRDDVVAAFPLGDPVPLAWAVRQSNPELLEAVNKFIDNEYRGLTYNVLHSKYFENPKRIRRHVLQRSRTGELSPYDELVKRYADRYDFDWRIIVALIEQESGFDPRAHSFAGAVGLMQVLPRTAEELGHVDLEDPETNIKAGMQYLSWVRDRFEEDLSVRDRMWFTLAGYNAGPGHVRDARRLAAEQGWNPDRWFDNVERAMLLLSRSEYARRARHGYCRGQEPVQYVREIQSTYQSYLDVLANGTPASNGRRQTL